MPLLQMFTVYSKIEIGTFAMYLAFKSRSKSRPKVKQLKTLCKVSDCQAALGFKLKTFQSPVQNITGMVENLVKGVINVVFLLLTAHPVDVT